MEPEFMESDKKECRKCTLGNIALAAFGIAIGLAFLYVSIDVLTNGRVTALWSPGRDTDGS